MDAADPRQRMRRGRGLCPWSCAAEEETVIARCLYCVACLLAGAGVAQAQSGGGNRAGDFVVLTMAYVQECIQADDLLRKTCARIGAQLSQRNRGYCALPPEPFEARTARAYRAFRDAHRAEIEINEAKFQKLLGKTSANFERQFGQVRAGKVSMPDLESLSGEVKDRCVTVEREWLVPNPRPR
jgi:hypothetical protein